MSTDSIWDRLRNYADDIHSDYNIHHVGLEWLREAAEQGKRLKLNNRLKDERIAELEALLREAPNPYRFNWTKREANDFIKNCESWHDRVQEALQDE